MQREDSQLFGLLLLWILTLFGSLMIFGHFTPPLAEDYNSMIEKGDKYYEQFNNLKALEEYRKAHELSPDSFEALIAAISARIRCTGYSSQFL